MRSILAASLLAVSMPGPATGADGGLAVDPAALLIPADAPELSANAALPERLRSSPHSYYRRIGSRFTAVICQRFADRAAAVPTVTLHGDAHLEQYAVTDRGRGLSDFDDSTTGSALIDLARFATSLELAARERGFASAPSVTAFQEGYARALRDPDSVAPEPAFARDLRRGFDRDRKAALARSESLMVPLPEGQTPPPAILQRASELLAEAAHRPVSFFHIKKLGSLNIGIGSVGDERYLLRIDAGSPADKDDIILELKEVRVLADLPCLRAETGGTRIVVAQAQLAYEAFSYVGTLALESPAGPRYYWFHAWPDNYAELRVAALPSAQALGEIAFDVGVQLGRGHGQHKGSGESKRLREQLKAALPGLDLASLATALADASEEAWRRFCAQKAARTP